MSKQSEEDVGEIIEEVSRRFKVSIDDMFARNRTAEVAFARQVAMTIVREKTGASYPAIGLLFQRHHTDVIHAVETINARCANEPAIRTKVDAIRKKFKNANHPK